MEVTLQEGDIIYIPAYWWYSIKFDNVGSLCEFKYRTYMNTLAISHHICLCFLQRSNVQRKTAALSKHAQPSAPDTESLKEESSTGIGDE